MKQARSSNPKVSIAASLNLVTCAHKLMFCHSERSRGISGYFCRARRFKTEIVRDVSTSPDMTTEAVLTKSAVVKRAGDLLPDYREIIEQIPPEAGFGGIWESEMFLFYAAVKPFQPKQILESGRARGKSTLILAHCFPGVRTISVEFDRNSENAAAAEEKLRPFPNVELVYGDSREIFPRRLQTGDAILIDGPKG